MALFLVAGCESYSTLSSPRAVTRAVAPQMTATAPTYNPGFGDNAPARRAQLSTPGSAAQYVDTDAAAKGWYQNVDHVATNPYDPAFGDNTFARKTGLCAPSDSTINVEADAATSGWYYQQTPPAAFGDVPPPFRVGQSSPQFGDNTYERRRSLSSLA